MKPSMFAYWSELEDGRPASCRLDKQITRNTGTWEMGVRLSESGAVKYGALIFKADLFGTLTCSLLSPADRLHRGY